VTVPRALRFYALLVVIMGGQLVSMALDRPSWPYSPFAMFSYPDAAGRTFQRFLLIGLAEDGSEIPLEPCLRPLTALQIHQGIGMVLGRADGEAALRVLLRDAFDHCQRTRSGAADHPSPLAEVKVREVTWRLDADPDRAPPPERIERASYAPAAHVSP